MRNIVVHRILLVLLMMTIGVGCFGPTALTPKATGAPAEDRASDEGKGSDPKTASDSILKKQPASSGTTSSAGEPNDDLAALYANVSPETKKRFEDAVAVAKDDPNSALATFDSLSKTHPAFYLAHYNLGVIHDNQGRTQTAAMAYQAARDQNPNYAPAVLGLTSIAQRNGKLDVAEQLLADYVAAHDNAWDARAMLAGVWAQGGQLQRAHKEAIAVLHGDETNAEAMLALGMVFRRQKKFELATVALNQALGIHPNHGGALSELGLVLIATGKKGQAVTAFERAAVASPGVASVHNNLGALRNDVGAFKAAIENLTLATQLRQDVPQYYLNLGNAYRGNQNYAEAEHAYKEALGVHGGTPQALFNLGVLYLDNELPNKDIIVRYEECIEFLRSYLSKVKVGPAETKRIDEYVVTAQKAIVSEQKKRERAQKRAARELERAKEEAQKAEEEVKQAEEAKQQQAETPAVGLKETPKVDTMSKEVVVPEGTASQPPEKSKKGKDKKSKKRKNKKRKSKKSKRKHIGK